MRKTAAPLFSAVLGLALILPSAAFAIPRGPSNSTKPTIAGVAQVGQVMSITDEGYWILGDGLVLA